MTYAGIFKAARKTNGRKTIPKPPPRAVAKDELPDPADDLVAQWVQKTSEGAKKAWLTRGKSSGSKTLDAIRASAKGDEAARAQFRQMNAAKPAPGKSMTAEQMKAYNSKHSRAAAAKASVPKNGTKKSDLYNQLSSDLGLL